MSQEQLKAFIEQVKADISLQDKINAAADSDAVFAIAIEAGFVITADDWNKAQSKVSDEELELAAGGGLLDTGFFICGLFVPPGHTS